MESQAVGNMAYGQDKSAVARLVIARDRADEASLPAADEFGLPFEPLDTLSDPPFEFEKMASALWEDAQTVYLQSAAYNRFSPHYVELLGRLEKIVKQMASFCVTKAVLEKKKYKFPDLEDLKIWNLYCISAFHFRKCHEAFTTLQAKRKGTDLTLLDWEFRWYAVAERLKATENRIRKIKEGKIKIDELLERAETFRSIPAESPVRNIESSKSAAVRAARSYPVIRSFAKGVEDNQKEQERERNRFFGISPAKAPVEIRLINDKDKGKSSSEEFMKILLKKTEQTKNGSSERLLETPNNPEKLYDPVSAADICGSIPRMNSPSDAVRKKLREKRKKKK